jgi:U3 small nucleolar RNA-associated protein 10
VSAVRQTLKTSDISTENIIAAESNAALTQFLVDQLHTTAAKPRLLAHLVVGNALRRLNGSGQVAFAARVIKAIVAQPASGASDDAADFDEPFAAAYLQAIVTKPHEARTARRARASVLACMVGVAMPVNGVSNWLNASLGTSDDQGIAFRSFADSLYVIANGDLVPSAFAAVLLRSLLASLREDALLFLTRTWLFAEKTSIKVSALRHAQAFMQAYVSPQTKKSTADFQVILPALLLAVQDPAKAVRQAAVALVKILVNVTGEKAVDIYALDSVYAVRSGRSALYTKSHLTSPRHRSDSQACGFAPLPAAHCG